MSDLERFLDKVEFTGDHWLWTGSTVSGYGVMRLKGKVRGAQRLSYANLVGPIRPGNEIHHTCEIKHCVNPDHLRSVTHQTHARLTAGWRCRRGVWFCGNGHKVRRGARGYCLDCRNDKQKLTRSSRAGAGRYY